MLKAKEIAEIIGVSQATLSLVVNNKPGISAQTRQKVISQLKSKGFDYLLNETAEAEYQVMNSKTIGFVIYRAGGELLGYDSFLPLIIDGLEQRARKYGYNLSYINISKEEVDRGIQYIKDAECSGYVLFATEMKEEDLEPFDRLRLPFVLLDNYFNSKETNAVKVNNEQGTYLGVKYLHKMGHRKVGYLRSGVNINSFEERCQCAVMAMHQMGMENPEQYVYTIGYPTENAYKEMKKLLKKGIKLPTAFLTDNDLVAAGAIKALKEEGYDIPADISMIGFDNRPISFLVEPALTTISLPRQYFGPEAIEILVRMLNGETDIRVKTEISASLLERNSVLKNI